MYRYLLVLIGLASSALAQTPITDTVVVTFPNEVQVAAQLLPPGEYTIRQLSSASNSRLLEFSSDKGTTIQATATAIPAIDNNNRNDSSVILENRGARQHVHRIWVKGKTYGYEFPIEKEVASTLASSRRETRLTASYEPKTPEPAPQVAQAAPAPAPAPTPEPTPEPARATPAPEPTPAPAPAPAPQQAAQAPAPQTPATTAQRSTPKMPETSVDWANYVWSGMALMCTGLLIGALAQRKG